MNIFKRFAGRYAQYKTYTESKQFAATASIGSLLIEEMDNEKAPNNIEVTFTDGEGKVAAIVTVCRAEGKSPAQQLHEMKQERDELVAENKQLSDMVRKMGLYLGMSGEYPEKESDNPIRQWLFDAIEFMPKDGAA